MTGIIPLMSNNARLWHTLLSLPLALLALHFMKANPEFSPLWYAGLGIAVLLGILYVARELGWIAGRQGRPCGQCGKPVTMKSFRVHATCPHCGQGIE